MKLRIKYENTLITVKMNDRKELPVEKILTDIRTNLKITNEEEIKLMFVENDEEIPSTAILSMNDFNTIAKKEVYLRVFKLYNDKRRKEFMNSKNDNNNSSSKTITKLLAEITGAISELKEFGEPPKPIPQNLLPNDNPFRLLQFVILNGRDHDHNGRRNGVVIEMANNNNPQTIQRLMEMGFPENRIPIALNLSYGNLELASHILLNSEDIIFENPQIYQGQLHNIDYELDYDDHGESSDNDDNRID